MKESVEPVGWRWRSRRFEGTKLGPWGPWHLSSVPGGTDSSFFIVDNYPLYTAEQFIEMVKQVRSEIEAAVPHGPPIKRELEEAYDAGGYAALDLLLAQLELK